MSSSTILQLDHFSKCFRSNWTFRAIPAVTDVSLEVYRGESFGFLGHNGAGKTTTMKCVTGLLRNTSGRILLDGRELTTSSQRSLLGYLPELPYFYDHLSVQETLEFFACLYGLRGHDKATRVTHTLELVKLADRKKNRVHTLSKGLQQRLGLAQAIIHRPELLLLDEPFSGLDPIGRKDVREILLDLKQSGTTIFMSSHILSDVEELCDRVAIMARGTLRSVFSLREAPQLFGQMFELAYTDVRDDSSSAAMISSLAQSLGEKPTAHGPVSVAYFDDYAKAERALHELTLHGARVLEFRSVGLSLEDIFISITTGAAQNAPAASPARVPGGGKPGDVTWQ